MKRLFQLALLLLCFATVMFAQSAQEVNSKAELNELATNIQTELVNHGERVLGDELYHWSTRLEQMADCRVELSVRMKSELAEQTVREDKVRFSLGALDPLNFTVKKNGLELFCSNHDKCVSSLSTCSKRSKDGIITDCTTASQPRVELFLLQFDGDATASARLERAFRRAIDLCRTPVNVSF